MGREGRIEEGKGEGEKEGERERGRERSEKRERGSMVFTYMISECQ